MDKTAPATSTTRNNLPEEVKKVLDALDYEGAKPIIEFYLQKDENNCALLDAYSEVLIQLDEIPQAEKVLKRWIEIEPNEGAEKYMSLGQISDYKISVKCYEKGIEIFEKNYRQNPNNQELRSSLASAYASLGELYMTTDLCTSNNAEELCEKYLTAALEADPNSYDGLIQMSNLRILRCRDEEAQKMMDKMGGMIQASIEKNDDTLPSQDIIFNLSKNYSELKNFPKAIQVLDFLIKLDEENVEYWYYLAFNHFEIQNYKHSFKCLDIMKKMKEKTGYDNSEIEDASNELLTNLKKLEKKNKKKGLTNNKFYENDADEKYDMEEESIENENDGMNID